MNPDIFKPKNIIVQGITGSHGSFHTKAMREAGTNIVAGTSPNKAGHVVDTIPVYSSIQEIKQDFNIDASVIFVPAPFAKNAIIEAIEQNIPLIVCITEGIPIHDMLQIHEILEKSSSILIGPNCPGLIGPDSIKLGIIPHELTKVGSIAVVSRSGTLTYEVTGELTARSIGQRYVIGIGGDRIHGIGFVECLVLFENDPEVSSIVMIGEIGGKEEIAAAEYIKNNVTKPVYGYITGASAPKDVQLGHAGAILKSEQESAQFKSKKLKDNSVFVGNSVTELVSKLVSDEKTKNSSGQ